MFDRLSYINEPPAAARAGDLFYKYEIKNWEFTPRIYKILAISAVINALGLLLFAQTNILTMRGCDSPLVGPVCRVLDTVYVGAVIFGTDRDFIDAEYERVDLGEAEVVWLDRTGEAPPFAYPEGYFQVANPENAVSGFFDPLAALPSQNNNGGDLLNTVPILPPPIPDETEDEQTPPANTENAGSLPENGIRKPKSNSNAGETAVNNLPPRANSNANTAANAGAPEMTSTDPVTGIEINKRPIVDLGNYVNELLEKKEVDLQSDFIVNARGKLDKDGRLDPKTFKFLEAAGENEKMVEVVKESIEALNVAGYLQYLKELSGKDIALVLQQDDANISAVIQSEMESETRAKTIKSALDLLINISKAKRSAENADQNDKDDLLLLEAAAIETDGKKVVIRFSVPKEIVHPMIQRKLAEQAAELAKPSSSAAIRGADNTAVK